jgi:membrane protein required for colicin V production
MARKPAVWLRRGWLVDRNNFGIVMNLFDIAILLLLAGFLFKGLWRGLLRELCSLCGLFGGLFLAVRFHAPLAELLIERVTWPNQLCVVIAFAALLLLTVIFFGLLGFVLSRFIKLLFLGGFNRVAGALFGLVQGGLLLTLVLYGLSLSPLPPQVRDLFKQSQLAPPLVRFGDTLLHQGGQVLQQQSAAKPLAAGNTVQSPGNR